MENSNRDCLNHQKTKEEERGLKKATFLVSRQVLDQLSNAHLKLQLEKGKSNVPPKEVLVEEAIASLVHQLNIDPDECLSRGKKRHQQR